MTERPVTATAYLQVILMFAIIIFTLLLGFYMIPGDREERDRLLNELGTTNHGTFLLPVKSIAELPLTDDRGEPWRWEEHKPKWRMLIPSNENCDNDCQQLLYTTRQVHIRLGKYSHRLERLLVTTDGQITPELSDTLRKEHPYLQVVHTDSDALARWLAETNRPWHEGQTEVILVDPAGRAMMTYDVTSPGNDVLEDLNHLLKYSAD